MPYLNSSSQKKSFNYNGAVLWNELPADMKNLTDIVTFKIFLKIFILS